MSPAGAAAGTHLAGDTAPAIRLEAVSFRKGRHGILDGIDLAIAGGTFAALLGPSGAGKTSLLRLIAGLDPCDRGRIDVGGDPVRIGFVFQRDALFPHMDVAANVGFGARVQPRNIRPDAAAIAAIVDAHLALVGLDEFGARRPASLSGGQRQRVALARALAADPAILLLDEPFGALDPEGRRTIGATLRRVHDERGLTTLLVTHDATEAAALADRVITLRDGRISEERDGASPRRSEAGG